jgi:ribosomal subunit interface protein
MEAIVIHGRNITLTDALKQAVNDRMGKIGTLFSFLKTIEVHLSVGKNPRIQAAHKAECVLHVNGGLMKVTASSTNLYASLDLLLDKVLRALRKYKTRNLARNKSERAKGENIRILGLNEALRAEQRVGYVDIDDYSTLQALQEEAYRVPYAEAS